MASKNSNSKTSTNKMNNDQSQLYKPGEDNCPAGSYIEVGEGGSSISNARTCSIDQGDRLPPTQQSGNRWQRNE